MFHRPIVVGVAMLMLGSGHCFAGDKANAEEARKLASHGMKLFKQKRNSEAIDRFNESLELDPQPTTYMRRAMAWSELTEYDAAVEDCSRAIKLDPNFAMAYSMRGCFLKKNKDINRAIADVTKAIELDDSNAIPFVYRAAFWKDLGQNELAIADFNEAIEREPNRVDMVSARAACWHSLQKWDKLHEDAETIIALEPENVIGYLLRADACCGQGDYATAHKDYLMAITLDENDLAVRRRYSSFLAGCPDQTFRDNGKALQLATQVCEQTKWQDSKALSALAYAHYTEGRFDDAIKLQAVAIKLASVKNRAEAEEWLKTYEARKPLEFLPR
jgi:tetratricopeptide (TPR) repeat protein